MYFLFLACAAIPIGVVALLALTKISAGLEEQARERLRRTVKVAGMAIVDRLYLAEVRLRTHDSTKADTAVVVDPDEDGTERTPFQTVGVLNPTRDGNSTGPSLTSVAAPLYSAAIDSTSDLVPFVERIVRERSARLEAGDAVVVECGDTIPPRLVLVAIVESPHPRVVWGVLRPDYLFDGEGDPDDMDGPGLVVLSQSGQVVHASDECTALVDALRGGVEPGSSHGITWENATGDYIAQSWTLFAKHGFDIVWTLALSEEKAAFLAPIARFRVGFALVAALSILMASYVSLLQIRRELVPIDKLHDATVRVASGDFETKVTLATGDEFEDLARSFNTMSDEVRRSLDQRRRLIDLGIHATMKTDTAELLDDVLESAPALTGADRVIIGVFSDDETVIQLRLGDASGSRSVVEGDALPAVPGVDLVSPNLEVALPIWRTMLRMEPEAVLRDLRLMPLVGDRGTLMGVMAFCNPTDGKGESSAVFSEEQLALGRLLAAQTAAALVKTRLLQSFKGMFEGMTRLITVAIDEKSPYTYGHCQRVPLLTMMIANAACEADSGALADFSLTPDELYELELAALLHDCGKVTTPVHVVDKGTKLQTIFDRIELVATRFEVVRRELQAAGTAEAKALLADLDSDLSFLRTSNRGVERLPQDAPVRVRAIATKYTWSDASGRHPVLTDDEIENLSIVRGTLNNDERRVIENHVVATGKMLRALPYPRHLRRVPEIAASHHERIDGSGYPDGVRGEALSIQARILAIADVFEALTAKDRPYKDGRKLSEALAILGQMKDQGVVDPALFELFVQKGVYADYARQYLEPNQIDMDLDGAGSSQKAA